MSAFDLRKFNFPAPRYTSYPTAPEWGELSPDIYREKLQELPDLPLSLYFHIPFCKTMCLYCACSVVLNRKPENEERYVDYLMHEIDLVTSLTGKRRVVQLHFGGGTPTKLSIPLFARLFEKIRTSFDIDFSQEVAIEIDPRTADFEKLRFLRKIGFNRVSFGVQDTNWKVQEAVKRRQSLEMTIETYKMARNLGFKGVNIDLIYGLPYQTVDTFRKTVSDILEMRPDRIALFSYAKVPWLKKHQLAIKDETLPSAEEKFSIYSEARERFIDAGYLAIGMDHFALEEDEMAHAFRNRKLGRNFQGYTTQFADEMLGFGVTAIGCVRHTYVQNLKDLPSYYAALDEGRLPVHRGKVSTDEDILRKWVIHTLMGRFELDKAEFEKRYGESFDLHFAIELERLAELEAEGLLLNTPERIVVTELGELLIRVIAMTFDAYIQQGHKQFSQSI
ncbi:MAG: oxygen-independent coproporphyrinogen III oxidase [Chlamydiales bacterium]|nr:oxygen-independent coproporphyrinogen III oxidase [Chlamydiales bacterium]